MSFWECFIKALKYPRAKIALLEVVGGIAIVWIVVKVTNATMIQAIVSLFSLLMINGGIQEFGKYYLAIKNGADLDEDTE